MNTEIKKQWIEALRSGKYKQGKKLLHFNGSFCCLGVLCDLHANATNNNWKEDCYLDSKYYLPKEVSTWASLSYNSSCKLAILNDIAGYSFAQIADYIETREDYKDESSD